MNCKVPPVCKNATYSVATLGDVTKPSLGPREGGGLLEHGPTARAGLAGPCGGSSLHDGFAWGSFNALHVFFFFLMLFMLKHGFCHL